MSLALSNDIKEKDIHFGSESLVSISSEWNTEFGEIVISDSIKISSLGQCSMTTGDISNRGLECNYLKLVGHITCDDKTLSTDFAHMVSIIAIVEYLDGDIVKKSLYQFFPKYDFEENYKDDYLIIKIPNKIIQSISVTIMNREDVGIEVTDIALYYSRIINENYVKETARSEAVSSVQDAMNDGTMALVIPLVQVLPDISTVPDGYICRLATLEAVE